MRAHTGEGVSGAFFGYVQRQAHTDVAVTICKIYEYETPGGSYELNSISGIIRTLERKDLFTSVQIVAVERFGTQFGNIEKCVSVFAHLKKTYGEFQKQQVDALRRLKDFRDKYAAHAEFGFQIEPLPSHDDFEVLLNFASEFYRMIHDDINNVVPSPIAPHVGTGLIRTLKALGITDPLFDFPKDKN